MTRRKPRVKTTEFALPGYDQTFSVNKLYLGTVTFIDSFLLVGHFFVNMYTFNFWGQGHATYVLLSLSFIVSDVYSLCLANVSKG